MAMPQRSQFKTDEEYNRAMDAWMSSAPAQSLGKPTELIGASPYVVPQLGPRTLSPETPRPMEGESYTEWQRRMSENAQLRTEGITEQSPVPQYLQRQAIQNMQTLQKRMIPSLAAQPYSPAAQKEESSVFLGYDNTGMPVFRTQSQLQQQEEARARIAGTAAMGGGGGVRDYQTLGIGTAGLGVGGLPAIAPSAPMRPVTAQEQSAYLNMVNQMRGVQPGREIAYVTGRGTPIYKDEAAAFTARNEQTQAEQNYSQMINAIRRAPQMTREAKNRAITAINEERKSAIAQTKTEQQAAREEARADRALDIQEMGVRGGLQSAAMGQKVDWAKAVLGARVNIEVANVTQQKAVELYNAQNTADQQKRTKDMEDWFVKQGFESVQAKELVRLQSEAAQSIADANVKRELGSQFAKVWIEDITSGKLKINEAVQRLAQLKSLAPSAYEEAIKMLNPIGI